MTTTTEINNSFIYLQTQPRERSGRSSPTDSESVFTDDEDWTQPPSHGLLGKCAPI